MIELKIKPLSANEMWQGKKVKSAKYRKFEEDCLKMLMRLDVNKETELQTHIYVALACVDFFLPFGISCVCVDFSIAMLLVSKI